MLVIAFSLMALLDLLIWLGLAGMAFWVWSGTKAKSTLMTMIGAALLALTAFFMTFAIYFDFALLPVAGAALVAVGYYFTVKPVVDARVKELKEKAASKMSSGSSGSNPPAAPPPAK